MNKREGNLESHNKRGRRRYVFLSVFSLLGGMAVYFLFRNADILLFDWFARLKWLNGFYIRINTKQNVLLSVLVFSVPDGLWLFSALCCVRAIWWTNQKMGEVYVRIFSVMAFCFETLQIAEKVPGTFDVIDLVCMALAVFVEGVIFRCFIRRSVL